VYVSLPLVNRATQFRRNVAIVDKFGQHTFDSLLETSGNIASGLLNEALDLKEERVCMLIPASFDYVVVQWGIWRAGGIAVPLCTTHPLPELEYVINDSDARTIVYPPEFKEFLNPLINKKNGRRFVATVELPSSSRNPLPAVGEERRAMILYTSGTTSRPKGVVLTHLNIESQITSLVEAWDWSTNDYILNVLPLHHVHGIINVLSCALWSGAKCEMIPKFNAELVWKKFSDEPFTLFMAVPTIYHRLIAHWGSESEQAKQELSKSCRKFRLMVSGSAPLPVNVLEEWGKISGHVLLERYGMTEIGMGLSNPLHGERKPGFVGKPLPNVQVKLVDEDGKELPPKAGIPGEIYVKGPNVFSEYWGQPEITDVSFHDGWFKTGDVALQDEVDGDYRILGRRSIDIMKTGGYKVSALEIEELFRTHPAVEECAVVGVEDDYWGERVCAGLILKHQVSANELSEWAKLRIAGYKVPKQIQIMTELPRNAMGKVVKPELRKLFSVEKK